jgi:hypothetical protein
MSHHNSVHISDSVYITRAPTDPVCCRVSVGGNAQLGFYCTFRGSAQECIAALAEALNAMAIAQDKCQLDALPVDPRYKIGSNEMGAS